MLHGVPVASWAVSACCAGSITGITNIAVLLSRLSPTAGDVILLSVVAGCICN